MNFAGIITVSAYVFIISYAGALPTSRLIAFRTGFIDLRLPVFPSFHPLNRFQEYAAHEFVQTGNLTAVSLAGFPFKDTLPRYSLLPVKFCHP